MQPRSPEPARPPLAPTGRARDGRSPDDPDSRDPVPLASTPIDPSFRHFAESLSDLVWSALPDGRRILLVDDGIDAATTLARLLRRMGHEVEMAHDGPTGVEAAARFVPELAFLDIGLPGMDGYALARTLRGDPALRGTYLVALTGYGSDADRRRSAEAGFDAHLVKPVDFDELTAVLTRTRSEAEGDRGSG